MLYGRSEVMLFAKISHQISQSLCTTVSDIQTKEPNQRLYAQYKTFGHEFGNNNVLFLIL